MESLRDIKKRKIATEKTAQITNAMNMVSASKLRKSEKQYKQYLDYLLRIEECVSSIVTSCDDVHPMFDKREVKKTAYIMITSDRGLAASYNSNIFKKINEEVGKLNSYAYIIGAIGRKGYSYCQKKKMTLASSEPIFIRDDVEFADIKDLSDNLIKDYLLGNVDEIVVCYNHFVNTLTQEVVLKTLLPIEKMEKKSNVDYEFDQGVEKTLDLILPMYIENMIYGFILDAKTSEHASRMTAMKNATDNASEVINQLQLIYNRARQAAITKELTDIIGGANAV